MKKLTLILALCFLPSASATVITTTSTGGSCASGASFVGGVAPNVAGGDQVIIADGATLDVPSGTTCWLGTYPVDDTGAVALADASSAGTGILTVEGTLRWSGPVRQANATWTVNAGGKLHYDASGAATPATALYTWQIAQANLQANAVLKLTGTSTTCNPFGLTPVLTTCAIIDSDASAPSGGIGITGTAFTDGGRIETSYADITGQGPSTTSGSAIHSRLSTSAGRMIFSHTHIHSSAGIYIASAAISATSTFQFDNSEYSTPTNTLYSFQIESGTVKTTGTREFVNSAVDGRIWIDFPVSSVAGGWTFKNSILSGLGGVNKAPVDYINNATADLWDQILLFGSLGTTTMPSGITLSNTAVWNEVKLGGANINTIFFNMTNAGTTFSNFVFGQQGNDITGDAISASGPDATVSGVTAVVHYNIFLPNSSGETYGSFLNDSGSSNNVNRHFLFDHNTGLISSGTGAVEGVGCETAKTWNPGTVTGITNNLGWRSASGGGFLSQSLISGGCTMTNAVSVADYNGFWNITGSPYSVPLTQYAATTGVHDITGNPGFSDTTRNLLTFDTAYLGNALSPTWVTGHAYSVGDKVSLSTSGFFGGVAINWVCITANTSGSTTQPGSGSSYATTWRTASYYDIKNDIIAGNTYNGGTDSLIGVYLKWVRAGFTPTNSAFCTAANDGTQLGAVPCLANSSGFFSMF